MTEPILLIMACQKYKDNLLRAIERMRLPEYRVIGLVGTTEPTTFDGTILSLQVEDSYEFLPKKVKAAFCWIHANFPDTVGIFKTDDDIFFASQQDFASALMQNVERPYWGLYIDCTGGGVVDQKRILRGSNTSITARYQAATYCYGHGYWISKQAIPLVCTSTEHDTSFLEDVCMGYVMNKAGYYPHRIAIPYQERAR